MSFVYQYKLYNNFNSLNTDEFGFNEKKWYLSIKKTINNENNIEYISIYLHCINPPSLVAYSIFLQKDYGDVKDKDIIKMEKVNNNLYLDDCGWGISKFIEKSNVLNRNNDFIIIGIKMEHQYDFSYENISKCSYFDDSILNDIKIIVENKEIYESKYILSIKSPYFLSMFKNDMIESHCDKNKPIEINNFKYEQVINVFYYLHTKKFIYYDNEIYIDKIMEMYEVADYFQIEELTLKIETFLINKINIKNFDKMILFSNKYNIENLKKSTINYISTNKKEIVDTKNFKNIIDSDENELIHNLFKKLILEDK